MLVTISPEATSMVLVASENMAPFTASSTMKAASIDRWLKMMPM